MLESNLRGDIDSMSIPDKKERLRKIIEGKSLLQGKEFSLASGATSSYYFNMKATTFDPEGADLIADLILDALEAYDVQTVGGLEMGAVPIASCVSLKSFSRDRSLPGFFVRKETKSHGTKALIEPPLAPGTKVAIMEDVTTTGGSAIKAARALKDAQCEVVVIVTLVDRLDGADKKFEAEGLPFIALLRSDEFILAS